MQHHITYGLTTPWLKQFLRNPYPKTVLWEDYEMDGRRRSGFYNLQVLERPSEQRTYYEMDIDRNVVSVKVSHVLYTTTLKDKRWGIDLKFDRSYEQATGGKLRVYLNDSLVDFTRPVTVCINGREVFHGTVQPNLQAMVNSCIEFFDPFRVYPAAVEVAY